MEARPVSHPPEDVLLALGSGKLDDATAEAIFFHVESCPECLKTAGRQSDDSFLVKLRAARGADSTPEPTKDFSTFPPAGNSAFVPTTSERPSPTILPELRDHPQYEVLRELGRGGMGIVYLANNKLMDRLEVLKVVNKQLLGDAGAAERFLREIRSAAQLIHPNIVTAFSALQAGELLLFSMEYIEGRDLAEVVKARGPLPAAHSGSYVLQAARGLQHAFEKGMVHRDIKPQNLILDAKKNIVKILDFGLAKATRKTTEPPRPGLTGLNMMMGTPDYMAPEQACDATNVDIRADVYSLGCTLYCLLAGRAPFVGGSLAMKIAAHQLSEPDPIESLRQDLPPGLAEIVRKMMAKDPAQRYQKPDDVVQALTSCFKGMGKRPTAKGSPVKVVTAKPVAASQLSLKRASKSIFEKKTIAPIAVPRQTMRERPSPVARLKHEAPARQRKKGLIAAGAAVALMLMGLIVLGAAGVFKVKTADGILVVNVNEPNAEVFVDGDRVTVTWSDGGKKAEIHVKPGTRKVEVKKDDFTVHGEEVEMTEGGRQLLTARLEPLDKKETPRRHGSPSPSALERIDVLKLIDPGKHTVLGNWSRTGDFLVSSLDRAFIKLPFALPEEYELEVEAQPISQPPRGFMVRFYNGQRTFLIIVSNTKSGVDVVDEKPFVDNPTTYVGAVLAANKTNKIVYTIKKESIQCTCDGKAVIDWKGDFGRITPGEYMGPADPPALGFDTWGPFVISKITLTPLSTSAGK